MIIIKTFLKQKQLNLGEGTITFISPLTYNDDKWHTIEAARQGKESILKVDEEVIKTGQSKGSSTELQVRTAIVKSCLICVIKTSMILAQLFSKNLNLKMIVGLIYCAELCY